MAAACPWRIFTPQLMPCGKIFLALCVEKKSSGHFFRPVPNVIFSAKITMKERKMLARFSFVQKIVLNCKQFKTDSQTYKRKMISFFWRIRHCVYYYETHWRDPTDFECNSALCTYVVVESLVVKLASRPRFWPRKPLIQHQKKIMLDWKSSKNSSS